MKIQNISGLYLQKIRPRNLKWVAEIEVAYWTFAVRFHTFSGGENQEDLRNFNHIFFLQNHSLNGKTINHFQNVSSAVLGRLKLVGERTALKSNIITFLLERCNCSFMPLTSNYRCAPGGDTFSESVIHLENSTIYLIL